MSETAAAATTRLTARGLATRERIVTAAAQLMFERGVAGTSTPDVRDAAGVSSSQIYHYFADKGALTRAVIELQTTRIIGGQSELLSRLDSFAALRAWRDAIVGIQHDLQCQGGCPLATLSGELAEHDAAARAAIARSFTLWAEAIRNGLQHMIEHGVLREDADAHHLSLAILAALQGGLVLAQAQRNTEGLEAGLDAMIELVEHYATARK
ncbi:TetR/AcrR family transcriptional regulator [Amycolatopsis carbonis]|uniref:TetR/AcrR family transcriptional regulator n=1 Tax=Amycolatopsis carbonis TaxID=715471 RepID=A0A9Y2N015_9PSEU|nr:TetR/AcrR family transcriptional regulator [Amycolatopsis sp. 2-15]WIX83198.1 TetR/AcrR family transcriptional regulator [Amycolatopsis sp. 2-15]